MQVLKLKLEGKITGIVYQARIQTLGSNKSKQPQRSPKVRKSAIEIAVRKHPRKRLKNAFIWLYRKTPRNPVANMKPLELFYQ